MTRGGPGELLAHFLAATGRAHQDEEADLAECVDQAVRRGHDAWPDLHIDGTTIARDLGARAPGAGSLTAWLRDAHVEDLALAAACARNDPGALALLEHAHGTALKAALSRVAGGTDVGELLQRLRERVLVGTNAEPPRIASYSGHGPLGGWLQVVAVRLALGERRRREAAREVPADADLLSRLPRVVELPEAAYLRSRHQKELEQALRESFAALDPQERNVLRLHYVDGVGVEKLGRMLGIHASNASRRITRIRTELLAEIRRRLASTLQVSEPELDSLLRVVRSGLSLSISRLLPPSEDSP